MTTKKRPVTIETLHTTGTSSSKPVYKSWELKYRVKDSVTGATISSPTVAIYVDGSKQSTSYSSGIIKTTMPNLGYSAGKTVKVHCTFSHSNYDSKTTSDQNVYYIAYKYIDRVAGGFTNMTTITGGRCMWGDSDGTRTSSAMAKENLKRNSGNSSYIKCSNKDYPIYKNGDGDEERRKPVQLKMTSWTHTDSLPSSVKSFTAKVYMTERNPSYTYSGTSYGCKVGKPTLRIYTSGGTLIEKVDSNLTSTNDWKDVMSGVDITSGVTWSQIKNNNIYATLTHTENQNNKMGMLYLSEMCITLTYIPNQSGY